jgi:multidrug efflux system membrane fusion protein
MNVRSRQSLFARRQAPGIAIVLLMVAGCSANNPPSGDLVRPVKTLIVTPGDETRTRTFPGTVEASKRVELAFQVPGVLVEFPAREGQKIAKGALIGQLRPDEFQARLKALQGQLDQSRAALAALRAGERPEEQLRREAAVRQAEARLANARAELNRVTPLLERRAISRSEFDVIETTVRVAEEDYRAAVQMREKGTIGRREDILAKEGEVRGLEARVVEADIQLRDTRLVAPYDGVIARRFVEQGQNIRPKEPVVRFQDVDEIEIVVDVPENVMAAEIQAADVISVVAELSGAPGVEFPVEVREVAQVADPTTQTFKVRGAMRAPEGIRALPGMTATATVTYRRAQILGNRVFVPIQAVLKDASGEQAVWVLGQDSTVRRRSVKLGQPAGADIEIMEGLAPGDRIAVAGVTLLRDGMKVRDLGAALGGSPL